MDKQLGCCVPIQLLLIEIFDLCDHSTRLNLRSTCKFLYVWTEKKYYAVVSHRIDALNCSEKRLAAENGITYSVYSKKSKKYYCCVREPAGRMDTRQDWLFILNVENGSMDKISWYDKNFFGVS